MLWQNTYFCWALFMLEGAHDLPVCGNFSHYSIKVLVSALVRMCRSNIVNIKERGDIIEEQKGNYKKHVGRLYGIIPSKCHCFCNKRTYHLSCNPYLPRG